MSINLVFFPGLFMCLSPLFTKHIINGLSNNEDGYMNNSVEDRMIMDSKMLAIDLRYLENRLVIPCFHSMNVRNAWPFGFRIDTNDRSTLEHNIPCRILLDLNLI